MEFMSNSLFMDCRTMRYLKKEGSPGQDFLRYLYMRKLSKTSEAVSAFKFSIEN